MYAVVKIGGRQYRVSEGDVLFVDRQHEEPGDSIVFDRVLMVNDDNDINIGTPVVDGVVVEATLLDQVKADKVIVFKKKRRKGYKKKNGHRQPLSQIKIESISTSAGSDEAQDKQETPETAEPAPQTVSTDMTAKEAIKHIESTPLDQLEGFVPENEDRVTVQRAWDDKQNTNEE